MNIKQDELIRIKQEYEKRDNKINELNWKDSIYHPRHSLGQLFYEHHRKSLIRAINRLDINLDSLKILDIGCGDGNWLRMLVDLGANPQNLTGIDLSEKRINVAKQSNPAINWIHGQEENIPLLSQGYDLVMQIVVFSSILNQELSKDLASEIYRLTKIGGYIVWLDHKKSFNEKLSGYSKTQILDYFPNTKIVYCDSVHPRYFRYLHKYSPWLCTTVYEFTRLWCDSLFIILQKI